TEAYDIYGIWHGVSDPEQKYRSIATDGAPWYIVRWKNNFSHSDVQYIGDLQLNYGFQNPSSKDAVTLFDDKIEVSIPWSLINVVAPDKRTVLNDDRSTSQTEEAITDGIHMAVYYQSQWYDTDQRFTWDTWNTIDQETLKETKKTSYWVIKDNLQKFNTPAIAVRDSFTFDNETFPVFVTGDQGLLKNDFDIDGGFMVALVDEAPANGEIEMFSDGSFIYQPNVNFNGYDSLKYSVFDGYSLSEANSIVFEVMGNDSDAEDDSTDEVELMRVFPNPVSISLNIETAVVFEEILVFNSSGALIEKLDSGKKNFEVDVSGYTGGMYLIVARYENKYISKKIVKE
ncbi:MAG TPA: Ig-like domain-containing protein, partial [Salinivirga sp.]|uniref:Ig-like domain-containing protein n=1 Tax=Salinivirga sp. TaxID=1970192 RepID=UPI002B48739A